MITQEFNLSMIPNSEPVVVHINKYDYGEGRFIIHLFDEDGLAYEPTNATIKIEGTKPDGNVFSYNATLSGSTVTANVDIQMTAVEGRVPTQLIVTEEDRVTGTFMFWMDVQESAINEKSPVSETEIPAIIEGAERQARRAEQAADTAVEASSEAETSKNSAQASASAAQASATSASTSATNASASATNAATSASNAATSETNAHDSAEDAEAWAVGERSGEPVPPTDPQYENSAKFWAEQAQQVADIHLMDNSTTGIGRPDTKTAEASNGIFSAIGTTIVGTVNPNASEDYAADWLLDANNTVITPDARRQYRVTIRGKAVLYYWNGTAYAPLGSSGHTIEKRVNGSIVPMAGMDNLLFDGVGVENDKFNNRTIIKPQFHVCATKAEWDAMSPAEQNDPLIYWVRPWASSDAFATDRTPVGTVVSVAGTYDSSLHKFPTDDYLVCNGASPVYINQYPKLAEYFEQAYGTKFYFNAGQIDPQDGTFAIPDWSADFPENGILCIKAQISSTAITFAEIDDTGIYAGEDKVPSCARIAEIEDAITESYTTLYPNTTGGTFRFTKRNNVVEIRGTILSNSCPVRQAVTLFTVGTEFRPTTSKNWTYIDYNNGIRVNASLEPNGAFNIYVYSDSPNVLRITEIKMYMM